MTETTTSSALFSPLQLRDIQLKNRIMVSPMCQYRSHEGAPSDWHLVHLGQFAIGGAALVFHEETSISQQGQKTIHCAALYNESQATGYRRINDFIHAQGSVAAIQLGHAGRRGSNAGAMHGFRPLTPDDALTGTPPWECVSASNIAHGPGWPAPTPLSVSQIADCIAEWEKATQLADEADFDVLEIHGAHGYLIHQFLSPLSNQRSDDYGGSRSNRMRFALEITEAVRSRWPDNKPLFFRMSCVDGQGGQWDMDDSVALAKALKDVGVDVIDCSSGGIQGNSSMPQMKRVSGYHLPFTERIRREVGIPTIAVGLITEAEQAEAILNSAQADIIAMAHELMAHPSWPLQAARDLGLSDPWSVQPTDYAYRLRRRDESVRETITALQEAHEQADRILNRIIDRHSSS